MLGFCYGGATMNKPRLLTIFLAAAALSSCATYDYVGANAPGGYYSGRAYTGSAYGPYYDGYGYPSYLYGGYGYRSYYGPSFYNPYYYGYRGYPYYPQRPHHPHPSRPHHGRDGQAPPWRNPVGGGPRDSEGRPRPGGGRAAVNNPGGRLGPDSPPPQRAYPSPQQAERSRPERPPQRSEKRDRVRTQEL